MTSKASQHSAQDGWEFWIDRGGTFTDIVARAPDGVFHTGKLLSENPEQYDDAATEGIRRFLDADKDSALPADHINAIKMGTTVGTNALLERKGDPTVLVVTKGFRDQLRIGQQHRPKIFARHIELPEMLYTEVIEADERVAVDGEVITPLDDKALKRDLQKAYDKGIRSCAIVFMHGYTHTSHEIKAEKIAQDIGFTQISVSHQVSPLIKFVGRGDTTVVDAYLSPVLQRYVDKVAAKAGDTRLMFMQSHGGLTGAHDFRGKDSILSGPAGGIVAAAHTSKLAGFDHMIGFDMGGTSTDVTHYAGQFERSFDTTVAGVRIRAPMMNIHTVAAGGGSICQYKGGRFQVGPESAGANPGPKAYRRGGPLTVTDCNVMLGKVQPDFFPHIFGPNADEALDVAAVKAAFEELAEEISKDSGIPRTAEEVAEGFLKIAVLNMARAIKKISVERGYDVSRYAMNCFGGAGGQHACLVADELGMNTVLVHPFAGVLSAYGMGLAETRQIVEETVETDLKDADVSVRIETLKSGLSTALIDQGVEDKDIRFDISAIIRYKGADKGLSVPYGTVGEMKASFETAYKTQFGFLMPDTPLVFETLVIEGIGENYSGDETRFEGAEYNPEPQTTVRIYSAGEEQSAPVFDRETLEVGAVIKGPAIIREATGTTVVEPGWTATVNPYKHLILERTTPRETRIAIGTAVDPLMLEVFNNLFMSIAERMGTTLEMTAHSVNIKERLDFSCAVFDGKGQLIANAPHIPVHLGSMGESIRAVLKSRAGTIKQGDVFILNDPYDGGTHLPDITVVTPVFGEGDESTPMFFVASRGHHADVGGITPGSMPPHSTHIDEEGIRITNFHLVKDGAFQTEALTDLFTKHEYPARLIDQNIADLKAQIAANEKGVSELQNMTAQFGQETVEAYMGHVQDNAEEHVREVIKTLSDGQFELPLDNGAVINVAITVDKKTRSATVDFTGTSDQLDSNFNAPSSIVRAALIYVFRTLVDGDIPMNEGCLKPINLILPEGSMLNPKHPAPVVAGNVETSQAVTNALYGALGVMAAAQGTMNNFTFGTGAYQYYETICGGSGAGMGHDGTPAVQTHMTNSRMTDPEVLELRYPVRLERFEIRGGSGGIGQYNGGDGVIRELKFLADMSANIVSNNRKNTPFGLSGGADAKAGKNIHIRANDDAIDVGPTASIEVKAGDRIRIETPGGGGFGKV